MNNELVEYCKKEIQDIENKRLISKCRSRWDYAAFYVSTKFLHFHSKPFIMISILQFQPAPAYNEGSNFHYPLTCCN